MTAAASIPCHVCGSQLRTTLYRQEFSGLSSGTFLSGYDVCICGDCGLAFADDLPSGEAFDRYYAEMSRWEHPDNGGRESVEDAGRFEDTAMFLAQGPLDRSGPVLDIGCSTGGLLAAMRREGFGQLHGLDPSPQCAKLARQNYGLDLFTGPVGILPELPSNFGLVCLSGVLEHFYDPNEVLQDIRARLVGDGYLYVSVPDATRFAEYMDAPFQQFSLEHIMYFTPTSLTNLLARNGFQPIKTRLTAHPYTRRYRYPSVEGIFRVAQASEWTRDGSGERGLRAYINASSAWEHQIERQIDSLVAEQQPVLVWGVGTNTQRLMATTALRQVNIVAFVDTNPHYHGKMLDGRPVLAPEAITQYSEPIVIASIIYRDEITAQIQQLGAANRLINLGGEFAGGDSA